MTIGAVQHSLSDVITGILAGDNIYWRYRMPRIVVNMLAGVGMAVSGALLQAALRNPLAAPDTLGITAGGGFLAAGRAFTDPTRLALTGVAVSVGLASLTQLLLVRAAPPEAGAAMTWLKGSLYARTMNDAVTVAPIVLIGFIVTLVFSLHLNALVLSDSTMRSIGVPVSVLRICAVILAALCGSAAASPSFPSNQPSQREWWCVNSSPSDVTHIREPLRP
ncbi:FecCD family ABC transporter permease [Arcanobacterium ihumii]|uniref:FecCD family ABC transporter permease n=1 Tax=Arcanobacterium ihumii TaxID=2138162 RepID=UPI001F3BDFE1|nr:iron ABC transporter permease [Arcanobacterium ihumii]